MRNRAIVWAWLYQLFIILIYLYLASQTPLAQHLKNDADFTAYLHSAFKVPSVWLELGRFVIALALLMYLKAVFCAISTQSLQPKVNRQLLQPMPLVLTTILLEFWLIQLNSAIYPFSAYGWLRKSLLAETPTIVITTIVLGLLFASGLKQLKQTNIRKHLYITVGFIIISILINVWPKLWLDNSTPKSHPQNPNIFILSVDSLRPDVLGINGFSPSVTPNLDRILPKMQRYENAWTPLARTQVSWMSIITGQYPIHHKLRFNSTPNEFIKRPLGTLEWLKTRGYHTMYAMDEWRFFNIDRTYGFDELVGPKLSVADFLLSTVSDMPAINLVSPYRISAYLFPFVYQNRGQDKTYRPEIFAENVIRAACANRQKPLFLGVHLNLSHWPFTSRGMTDIPEHLDKYSPEYPYQYLYLVTTKMADAQFGDIYQGLKQCGLFDNAIVFVISDHGENFPDDRDLVKAAIPAAHFEVNAIGHGTSVANPHQNHVLLAVQKYHQGRPTLAPVAKQTPRTLMDIMPTIVHWLTNGQRETDLFFDGCPLNTTCHPYIFLETSISPNGLSGSRLNVLQALMEGLSIYTVNDIGYVVVKPKHYEKLVAAKKRAVMRGPWILIMYPDLPDDLILVNRKQMKWWPASFAPSSAPVESMLDALCDFYQDDFGFDPHGLCQTFRRKTLDELQQKIQQSAE